MQDIFPKSPKPVPQKPEAEKKEKAPETAEENPSNPVSWQAPEYEHIPKNADWFWTVGIISLAVFFLALITKNILFGALSLLAGFTVALFGAKKPRRLNFEINPRGVKIENRLYTYGNLKSFWIHYDPPLKKELSLESKKTLMPYITIPLGEASPNDVRRYLIRFLKEEEHEESLSDAISHFLRF